MSRRLLAAVALVAFALVSLGAAVPPGGTAIDTCATSWSSPTIIPAASGTPAQLVASCASFTPTWTPTSTSAATSTLTWTPTQTPTPTATATFTPTLIPTRTPTPYTIVWTIHPSGETETFCDPGYVPYVASQPSTGPVVVACQPDGTGTPTPTGSPSPTSSPTATAPPPATPTSASTPTPTIGATVFGLGNPNPFALTIYQTYPGGGTYWTQVQPDATALVDVGTLAQLPRGACPLSAGCAVTLVATATFSAWVVGTETPTP